MRLATEVKKSGSKTWSIQMTLSVKIVYLAVIL